MKRKYPLKKGDRENREKQTSSSNDSGARIQDDPTDNSSSLALANNSGRGSEPAMSVLGKPVQNVCRKRARSLK